MVLAKVLGELVIRVLSAMVLLSYLSWFQVLVLSFVLLEAIRYCLCDLCYLSTLVSIVFYLGYHSEALTSRLGTYHCILTLLSCKFRVHRGILPPALHV